jgi:hypothetical protein
MMVKILKLFGLDVPARIAEARRDLERRVEGAAVQIKEAVAIAATLAILYALAALATLVACGIALLALDRYVTLAYGEFYGFATVAGMLIILAAILFTIALARSKSWANASVTASRPSRALAGAADANVGRATYAIADAALEETNKQESEARLRQARQNEAPSAAGIFGSGLADTNVPSTRVNTASDLVEPLTFLLSRMVRFPSTGHPVVDELVGQLRLAARETTDEAIEGAARTMRYGNRATLVGLLGGAALLGWVLARHGHIAPDRSSA